MGFFIKKFISQFFMPIPLVFELFLMGWLLTRFSQYQRSGRCLKGLALVLYLVFGYGVGAERYLYSLERMYPPVELDAAGFAALQGAAIIVLGQGLPEKSDLPLRYQTNASFQQRLQEGMRLYRKIPSSVLFVSLPGDEDSGTKERFVDVYAQEHDLKRSGIHLITSACDTSDEARLALDLSKTNRVVIVTSANHLPRAVKIFSRELKKRQMSYTIAPAGCLSKNDNHQQSISILIPFPCDYLLTAPLDNPFKFRLWSLPLPSVGGFSMTQYALHEWLGNLFEDLTK